MDAAIRQKLASRSHPTSTRCRKAPTPQVSLFRSRMFGSDIGYSDRLDAGEQLGAVLREKLRDEKPENIVVLGLVRGGLPVAEPVANALNAPLDAFISRKIGAPYQPEFGIGAIAEGGYTILNERAVQLVGATDEQLESIRQQEVEELHRRKTVYRGGKECLPVAGKTAVVVDDGLATGVTARAALASLKAAGAARLILAVPVGSSSSVAELTSEGVADEVVCLHTPKHFRAVGQWYEDFSQTTDAEVVTILKKFEQRNEAARAAAAVTKVSWDTHQGVDRAPSGAVTTYTTDHMSKPVTAAAAGATGDSGATAAGAHETSQAAPAAGAASGQAAASGMVPTTDEEVVIESRHEGTVLHGTLTVPRDARGLVVFAHGSGSSRNSPRNKQVATTLNRAGLATLLFDLLSVTEAEDRHNVFDIPLLASRLQLAVEWLEMTHKLPTDFPVGFFGASTGGGAALWAAAYLDKRVSAVVVRGGRPDLAAEKLPAVLASTLLLVGGEDTHVLQLNKTALRMLGSGPDSSLVVVPHAGHLFEGPGQLEIVAEQAVDWFAAHMSTQ